MRDPRACPVFAPMSGDYRYYNPSEYALLLLTLVRNRQIHEDLEVPLFAEHIRALNASFDSKLVRQLGRYLRLPRVDPVA
jgi:hypothetical protein